MGRKRTRHGTIGRPDLADRPDTHPHPGLTDRLISRLAAWTGRHRTAVDFLTAAVLLVIPAVMSEESGCAGLFLGQPAVMALVWTFVYAIPLALRHTHPDVCAWMTVGLLLLRLLIGPVLLLGDIAALWALFAGIAHGNPRRRWWYAGLGLALPVIFPLLDIAAQAHPPLLAGKNSGVLGSDPAAADLTFAVVGFLLTAVTIGFARHRAVASRQARLLRERNEALELSNRQREAEVVIAERARLARDMHDVAAHTLSILIVLADGGRYAGAHDSTVALSTMRTIKKEADRALRNTTALLDVTSPEEARPTQESATGPAGRSSTEAQSHQGGTGHGVQESHAGSPYPAFPQFPQVTPVPETSSPESSVPEMDVSSPSYAHIDALVQEARTSAAGRLIIVRKVKGRPDQTFLVTHPLVSETLYRMVEESLSNIRKYSGLLDGRHVRALIEETWLPGIGGTDDNDGINGADSTGGSMGDGISGGNGAGSVRIVIRDDGQGAAAAGDGHSAGYGLLGMRERVEACGGTLTTGPIPADEGGGFWVQAVIPVTVAHRAPADRGGAGTTTTTTSTDPGTTDPAITTTGMTGTTGTTAPFPSARWNPSSRWHPSDHWHPSGWWRRQKTRVQGIGSPAGYSVADIIISVCICLAAAMVFLPSLLHHGGDLDWWYCLVSYTGALGCAIPLAFLHPYPEKPAIVTSSVMGATIVGTIVLHQPLPFLSLVCGLVALYALIAYGPESARRWATPACVVLVLLACVGEVCLTVCHGGRCIGRPDTSDLFSMTALFIGSAIVFGATVLIVALLARLHPASAAWILCCSPRTGRRSCSSGAGRTSRRSSRARARLRPDPRGGGADTAPGE